MIQLKVRTEYSFGKTFAPIPRAIEHLKAMGCVAAGIVDGNTWGHVAWFKACHDAGIHPLLGVELIVTDNEEEGIPQMWFLATTMDALQELYRVTSLSYQQSVQTKRGSLPRLYRGDVEGMSEGIMKFAGHIHDFAWLKTIGAYVDHEPSNPILNKQKKASGLPLVYVSDNAYIKPGDRDVYEVLAFGGAKPSPQYLLQTLETTDAMREIVARSTGLKLPEAPMISVEGDLEALCREGIVRRKMETIFATDSRYEKRLMYELDIIKQKNYGSYFIVVADMVAFAKSHMLVGPSRGSAAGSLVCFLAGITEIDPLPPGLFFERFIDITRKDLPDIDLDFPDDKRHLVFEYMGRKYGTRRVAHIGTVMRLKPKSALGKVCKAMGIPPQATWGVKAAMIERSSADARANSCLMDTLQQTEPGRAFIQEYPYAAVAGEIEGHASHSGVHAAGLLVCNDDIMNYATVDKHGIAQVEMSNVPTLNLLKIDVLGLTTLSVLENCGVSVPWYELPLDDKPTYEVFNQGRLCGVFQFEGDAMRSIAQQMSIEKIDDVDAVTALARPGPFAGGVTFKYLQRKRGVEKVIALHPLVEPFMRNTYGLPIYQEQTLAIVREIGNFGWKEAAIIRKAMSKSLGVEFFNQYWNQFKEGAATHGIVEHDVVTGKNIIKKDPARDIWEMIMTMGSWQMNKAHTYSYAVISYWCAYLKRHHPLEFAASTLRCAKSEESALELLREMVKEGIQYVAFDPDLSEVNWSVKDGRLVGGFMTIYGLGEIKAKKLVQQRNEGRLTEEKKAQLKAMKNPFTDLWPIESTYGHILYATNKAYLDDEQCTKIADILRNKVEEGDFRYIVGRLTNKNPRNVNEDALIKKRKGYVYDPEKNKGKMEYLDLRIQDDTGQIGGRITRESYLDIGVEITESVPLDTPILVRAQFKYRPLDSGGKEFIPYAFVVKWMRLDEPREQWKWRIPEHMKQKKAVPA